MNHRVESSKGCAQSPPRHSAFAKWRRAAMLAMTMALALPAAPSLAQAGHAGKDGAWSATWGAAPAAVAPDQIETLDGQTLRMIVRVSSGGSEVRVHLSNEFGTEPLRIGAAQLALRADGASLVPKSERVLTFGGKPGLTIAPGEAVASDPVALELAPLAELAVSLYFPEPAKAHTVHRNAFQTSYLSFPGNFVGMSNFPTARTLTSWPVLTDVDVRATATQGAATQGVLVAFGDSITDGSSSTPDANRRWPDLLAQRLYARQGSAPADQTAGAAAGRPAGKQSPASTARLGIVNRGIGGNRLLRDPAYAPFGQAGLTRFERDVLGTAGVRHVTVLLGINDIGHPGSGAPVSEAVAANDLIEGYRQLIARAHAKGIKIHGLTMTPFEGTVFPGYFSAEKEAVRQAVNGWIRSGGAFDSVIDADLALRDPDNPARLLPAFDSGDHLHPNDAGMKALADAIPLGLFENGAIAHTAAKKSAVKARAKAHARARTKTQARPQARQSGWH